MTSTLRSPASKAVVLFVALHNLYVASSFKPCVPRSLPRQPACQHGLLPGRWLYEEERLHWGVFQPDCQLQDLAGLPTDPINNSTTAGKAVGILLLGDSVDRYVVTDICNANELGEDEWGHNVDTFCLCRKANYTVARQAVIGVDPDGPWYLHDTGTPTARILHGLTRFEAHVGRLPDVVTLSSAFWDLAAWTQHNPIFLQAPFLSPTLLQTWGEHLSEAMATIEEQVPEALWIFRTTAPPLPKDCADGSGNHGNPLLGKHSHVVDLNAMAREVAHRRGWALIDMERLAAPFHHHMYFMRDHTHPNGNMLLTALNMMLNLYQSSCAGHQ